MSGTSDQGRSAGPRIRGYVIYAVGEIVLVVVGILIALQIGEWSERRNDDERLRSLLREVREDLMEDVIALEPVLDDGEHRDTLAARILAGEVTREQFANPQVPEIRWMGFQWYPWTQRRTAWERVEDFDGEISDSWGPTLAGLRSIYVEWGEWLDLIGRSLEAGVVDINQWLLFNEPWYADLRQGRVTEEMLDWYETSPMFRNFVASYRTGSITRPGALADLYRGMALAAWAQLGRALGDTVASPLVPDGLWVKGPSRMGPWLGEWPDPPERLVLRDGILFRLNTINLLVPLVFVDDSTVTPLTRSMTGPRLRLRMDAAGEHALAELDSTGVVTRVRRR